MAVMAVVAFPIGMAVGDEGTRTGRDLDTLAGMFLFAGIIGMVAAPWIVRAWQSHMRRRMLAAVVAHRADITHLDGEKQARDIDVALASPAFHMGRFRDCGLIEAFESARVAHVLHGETGGVPFALAEVALLDDKHYRMFGGVLASFRLARPRGGLTVVTRDRGLLGNLLAGAGRSIERLTLEDPEFEQIFEVYGDDQVRGRVTLTTTMLQRLKDLDDLAHARGFACAFRGEHLLVAFDGMSWRCAAWRILRPLDAWLQRYSTWLTGLVDMPAAIVRTLNLEPVPDGAPVAASVTREPLAAVTVQSGASEPFSAPLFRIVGEGGMAAAYVASGSLFGGLALFAARYGITEGFFAPFFWYLWTLTGLGLLYGGYAVTLGLRQLGKLLWKWNSPLRTMQRPRR